jgi:methyl-accepting chemotaxis protein
MDDAAASARSSPPSADGWTNTLRDFVAQTPNGESIPTATWRGRHRNIVVVVLAHLPFLLGLGLYEGAETLVTGATIPSIPLSTMLLELAFVAALAVIATLDRFPRRAKTALATLGLLSCSVVLVHFSGGFIEAHFHFFVAMAVVAVYEDWVPFALGIGYVVLTHSVFGMINPGRVYNHSAAINNPWVWGLIHGIFVLALAIALMSHWYSTERSREEARQRLREAEEKTEQVADLEQQRAEIEQARAEAQEAKANAEARQREVERLNEHLEAKADAYSAAMQRAADGDLGVRLDTDSESDAMAQIGVAFNEMLAETETAIEEIQSFAREVATESEAVNDETNSSQRASEDVSQSLQEIASGADEQREMLETVSDEMGNLSATVEEVAASAETVAQNSRETAEIAQNGEETAEQALDDAQVVQRAIDETVENVEVLDEQMDEIGEIIELIGDIAEQTNMLALNANIEAARAGGGTGGADGEGFAVVADEVKQLAEETQSAASDIEQRIEEIQSQTGQTVAEARTAEQAMENGAEAVEAVVETFSRVAANADETDAGIQEIRDATDTQAASTEQAVGTIEEVTDISRTTADETAAASTTGQEQAASMSQISASVSSFAERAERLQSSLGKFDVGTVRSATSD